jgi:hypothetical protein
MYTITLIKYDYNLSIRPVVKKTIYSFKNVKELVNNNLINLKKLNTAKYHGGVITLRDYYNYFYNTTYLLTVKDDCGLIIDLDRLIHLYNVHKTNTKPKDKKNYIFRKGPVPYIRKKINYGRYEMFSSSSYKEARTTLYDDVEEQYIHSKVRHWDDRYSFNKYQKNWKKYRKTQYK